jgi:hypothetical protein
MTGVSGGFLIGTSEGARPAAESAEPVEVSGPAAE